MALRISNEKPKSTSDNQKKTFVHLIVISHGLMGGPNDLSYLGNRLVEMGGEDSVVVLRSKCNELIKTTNGVAKGGKLLAEEILSFIGELSDSGKSLEKISFVGNSLGGLYVRYAIKELFDPQQATIAGLHPCHFMTIATPHMGVRDYTFLDEVGIFVPVAVKTTVASLFLETGKDLFADLNAANNGADDNDAALLYHMATDESYLRPLEAFQNRRLYANLNGDLVVPLGTAAFMNPEQVQRLRSEFASTYGILTTITTARQDRRTTTTALSREGTVVSSSSSSSPSSSTTTSYDCVRDSRLASIFSAFNSAHCSESTADSDSRERRMAEERMVEALDAVGWEKVLVHFNSPLPLSHNKICALNKYPPWLNGLLGFEEGQFVMDQAAEWLLS